MLPAGAKLLLGQAGLAGAVPESLAGDASARRYWRLRQAGRTAILGHSPGPDGSDECRRFVAVGVWLAERGFSAPRILAADTGAGLMLVEDLGDDLVARLCETAPEMEAEIYLATAGMLADLACHDPPGFVRPLDGPALGALMSVLPDAYVPAMGGDRAAAAGIGTIVAALWSDCGAGDDVVLSLRDFHAENLIWLPGRQGSARLGLLDFQDAVAAHPLYDVVSLLQDARRDVSPEMADLIRDAAIARLGPDRDRLALAFALLGAQRALRIAGVFVRLSVDRGRVGYLDLLPRVWRNLRRNLDHPGLEGLRALVLDALPAPEPALIERVRQECRSRPTPS
jgi:aminoglycoside/choline kinase family phosphotransferase